MNQQTNLSRALFACLRSRSRSCFISGGSSSSAELTNGSTLQNNIKNFDSFNNNKTYFRPLDRFGFDADGDDDEREFLFLTFCEVDVGAALITVPATALSCNKGDVTTTGC